MTFDLHIHIDSGSPESHVVESMINSEHITPEEAVRAILRRAGEAANEYPYAGKTDPLWGLLRDDPETADAIENIAVDRRQAAYGA